MSLPLIDADSGEVEGVLVSEVRLKFMWKVIENIKIGESGISYIMDSTGRVIAHRDPSVVLRGTYFETPLHAGFGKGLTGTQSIMAAGEIKLGKQVLYLVTELPVSEALQQTKHSLLIITAFMALTLAGAFALGFIIIRNIVRPVESLSRTAAEISEGNLSRKAHVTGHDEIGVLGNTFNAMTAQLVETIDSLRQRIGERDSANKALHDKSDELQTVNLYLKNEMRKRSSAETALTESHKRLLTVLDSLSAVVYVADIKTYEILFINKFTRDVFGDIERKICWQTIQTGQSGPCSFCTNDKILTPEGKPTGVYRWEFRNTSNGKWYDIQDRAIQWVDGRMVRVEVATDITDRKTSEEKIKASLREKEVLLREVHHRTKNNMQVIYSLLNLQSQQIPDSEYHEMFRDSQNRIRSMSLVHEKLYRSSDLAHIDAHDYIRSLAKNLFDTYGTPRHRGYSANRHC
jgi:two-component sensor histidine kinase